VPVVTKAQAGGHHAREPDRQSKRVHEELPSLCVERTTTTGNMALSSPLAVLFHQGDPQIRTKPVRRRP
jgi:hypothetical protein